MLSRAACRGRGRRPPLVRRAACGGRRALQAAELGGPWASCVGLVGPRLGSEASGPTARDLRVPRNAARCRTWPDGGRRQATGEVRRRTWPDGDGERGQTGARPDGAGPHRKYEAPPERRAWSGSLWFDSVMGSALCSWSEAVRASRWAASRWAWLPGRGTRAAGRASRRLGGGIDGTSKVRRAFWAAGSASGSSAGRLS